MSDDNRIAIASQFCETKFSEKAFRRFEESIRAKFFEIGVELYFEECCQQPLRSLLAELTNDKIEATSVDDIITGKRIRLGRDVTLHEVRAAIPNASAELLQRIELKNTLSPKLRLLQTLRATVVVKWSEVSDSLEFFIVSRNEKPVPLFEHIQLSGWPGILRPMITGPVRRKLGMVEQNGILGVYLQSDHCLALILYDIDTATHHYTLTWIRDQNVFSLLESEVAGWTILDAADVP